MQRKLFIVIVVLSVLLNACQAPSASARDSIASFDALLKALPDHVGPDDSIGGYALESPDGSTRFLWSRDYSTSVYDAWLETDIMPFVEAGLDTTRLPEGIVHEGLLVMGADFGSNPPSYPGEATPLAAFGEIAKHKPDSLQYLKAPDHFVIDLGGGNLFEWASNIQAGDKDIVFVLDPLILSGAGVDPSKVPGWMFARVDTIDGKGNRVQADKLLKPFNIQ